MYAAERERIVAAAGGRLEAIEHVGSTAVPGLVAKPIIDIMGGVRALPDADLLIPAFCGIGYEYVPEYEVQLPERRYFRKGQPVTHHLHVVVTRGPFWTDHVLFRDLLRSDPAEARRYADVKRDLARRYRNERAAYTEAKAPFITAALARARLTGPSPGSPPARG